MSKTIRIVLYLDSNAYNANENNWYAVSKPCATVPGLCRRYQLAFEIPDPRGGDEVIRPQVVDVTDVTEAAP